MTKEVDRCREALALADKGKTVSLICSGDAGVYGMSGLVWQLHGEYPDVDIQVVAGVTAALAGAAVLGAPLIHDFCLISLSDLLTPWEKIEARLKRAAQEAEYMDRYDYLLVNDNLDECVEEMHRLIQAMRARTANHGTLISKIKEEMKVF